MTSSATIPRVRRGPTALPATFVTSWLSGAATDRAALRCRIFPAATGGEWNDYVGGLRRTYEAFGVGNAVGDLDPSTTPWVCTVECSGRILAGARLHVPELPAEMPILHDLRHHASCQHLPDLVRQRASEGIAEVKGLWVDRAHAGDRVLAAAALRGAVHAAHAAGLRWLVAVGAPHAVPLARTLGFWIDERAGSVGYPTERYRSAVMWTDLARPLALADAEQRAAFAAERRRLERAEEGRRARR